MTAINHCLSCKHGQKDSDPAPCSKCAAFNNWESPFPFIQIQSEGLKHDAGKPPISRIPRAILEQTAKVLAFGAEKYDWNNWRNGIKYHRVLDAAFRHLTAFADHETIDPESSLPHLAHAACCLAFLLEYEAYPEKYKEFDDRFSYLITS